MGRKARLTPERAAELRRRYRLHRDNRPEVLRREFGLGRATLLRYARDECKSVRG